MHHRIIILAVVFGSLLLSSSVRAKGDCGINSNQGDSSAEAETLLSESDSSITAAPLAGCGGETNPPTTPPSITATASSTSGNYTISWGTSTGFNGLGQRYNLYESVNGGVYSPIAGVSNTVNSYAVSGKGEGDYLYAVESCNLNSCSGWKIASNTTLVRKKPLIPVAITNVNSTSSSINLDWNKPAGTVTYYSIRYRVAGGTWAYAKSNTNSTMTSYTHTGRSNNINYEYKVRACNVSWSCSGYSAVNSVKVRFKPSTPAKPGNINSTSTGFTVSWSKPAGTVSFYSVQERESGGSWSTIASSTTALSKDINSKINGTNYEYRVRGCNAYSWACSSYSSANSVKVRLKPSKPAPPTLTSQLAIGAYDVKWAKPSGRVTKYYVYEYKNASSASTKIVNGVNQLLQGVTGRSYGSYTYRVKACNSYTWACSSLSNSSSTMAVDLAINYQYDALGRLLEVTDPLNGDRNYEYDAAGNRTAVTSEGGNN